MLTMSPTLNHFKQRNNEIFSNNSISINNLRNNSNELIPDLEPVLVFDGTDDMVDQHSDQIDGNYISVDGNLNNNNIENGEDCCPLSNGFKPTEALVRKQAPTFLLIESLIWSICSYYEKERDKQKDLYLNLCERLEKYKIIGTSYRSESLQPIRDLIVIKFRELVSNVRSGEECILDKGLCSLNNNPILNSAAHLIDQSSRYREEFQDLGLIEEGGQQWSSDSISLLFKCFVYLIIIVFFRVWNRQQSEALL